MASQTHSSNKTNGSTLLVSPVKSCLFWLLFDVLFFVLFMKNPLFSQLQYESRKVKRENNDKSLCVYVCLVCLVLKQKTVNLIQPEGCSCWNKQILVKGAWLFSPGSQHISKQQLPCKSISSLTGSMEFECGENCPSIPMTEIHSINK